MADHIASIADGIAEADATSRQDYGTQDSVMKITIHSNQNLPLFNFHKIDTTEVEMTLKTLEQSKATGWDSLPPRALKRGVEELALPLTTLFNSCIILSQWPSDWKKGEWTPVYKKDDQMDKQNYVDQ